MKILIIKSTLGSPYFRSYHAGHSYEIEDKLATEMIKSGHAREDSSSDLPADLPFIKELKNAKIISLAEVKELAKDGKLIDLKGIGEKAASAIAEYLATEE